MYLTLLLAIVNFACTTAFAEDSQCSNPKSTNDVLLCLDQNHPDVKKTSVDSKLAEGVVSTGTQIPNPELSFDTVKGRSLGETRGESTLAISQLIEISGKRGARKKLAKATAAGIRASSALAVNQARSANVLKFVRYRQLLTEIAVLEEAISTYEKVNRQFSSRSRLLPDQEVSSAVFRLALSDYRHRLAGLEAERSELESYFRVVPELNFEASVKYLPKRWKTWPKPNAIGGAIESSPQMIELESNLSKASAQLDLARAGTWPDLTVSLLAKEDVEGTTKFNSYGFGISLPLPLWNLNGGERQQAAAEKYKAELEFSARSKELALQRQNLFTSYQRFVKALEQSPDPSEIDRKHRNTESLFYRGVISGALVIEAHRQILDFTETSHELELETLQTLLNIYSLEGKLAGFKYE